MCVLESWRAGTPRLLRKKALLLRGSIIFLLCQPYFFPFINCISHILSVVFLPISNFDGSHGGIIVLLRREAHLIFGHNKTFLAVYEEYLS